MHLSSFPFFFHVHGNSIEGVDNKYHQMSGDYLKTSILNDFKQKINDIKSEKSLIDLKDELKKSAEFLILNAPQGWFTYLFGLKTSSVRAFEQMFEDKQKWFDKIGKF